MTDCCGLLLRDGLVMVAVTRTNAGVDNISTFRTPHTVAGPDRLTAPPVEGGPLTLPDPLALREGLHALPDLPWRPWRPPPSPPRPDLFRASSALPSKLLAQA